ncbi:MAG: MFS transporter [Candidatus Algichlamydia australiensis]|nr:MFS transporter [Chlamydiales bacterium]
MKFKEILPISTVVFLGYLGFSITFPIFPPLFLEEDSIFFVGSLSPEIRNIYLGLLLSMYPIGQLIGCPLIGKLSDYFGRKRVLLYSLAAIIPAYVGSAISVTHSLPFLLFLSRFLSGLVEGNIVIAQATLADIATSEAEKRKCFSWTMSLSSLAWVIGPFMGGKLSDPNLVSSFTYATPFWVAAVVSFFTFFYILKSFPRKASSNREGELKLFQVFTTLFRGLRNRQLRPILGVNTLLFMAIFFFFSFLPVFLVQKYDYSASSLAEIMSYNSIPIALAPLFQARLFKNLTASRVFIVTSFLVAIGLIIVIIPASPYALLVTLIPPSFGIAWGITYGALRVSENAPKEIQGEALGLNQSAMVFSEAFTAIIGGQLAGLLLGLPLMVGAGCAALAGLFATLHLQRLR